MRDWTLLGRPIAQPVLYSMNQPVQFGFRVGPRGPVQVRFGHTRYERAIEGEELHVVSIAPPRMKLYPKSIRGRLMLTGVLFTAVALIAASLMIGQFLDRFVRRGLDERLDAQIALLVRAVRPDGSIDRDMLQEVGPFTQHRRGWAWRVDAPTGTFSSEDVIDLKQLRFEGRGRRGRRPENVAGHPQTGRSQDSRSQNGHPQSGETDRSYVRLAERKTTGGSVRITASAPRDILERQRMSAAMPILATMAALSLALIASTLLQLRIGLKPLDRLKRGLADVRTGRLTRIAEPQPAELAPVVDELNSLLDENAEALNRTRGHVANLAHSIKTPLAALNLRLAELGRDPDGQLGELVAQVDGAVRHHLSRARAASPGAPGQPVVLLADAVTELLEVLARIHIERNVGSEAVVPQDLTVNCDRQDLTEMLGNLLDNAWRWAASRIVVTAVNEGKTVRIDVDDDGPGLTEAAIAEALQPGRRIDERTDGHGFGLPITRELAELHGGSLWLEVSPLGGLRATLRLPR